MNNNKEREARVKEINRLLKCLPNTPVFMSPQDYETMIEEWERGDRCARGRNES